MIGGVSQTPPINGCYGFYKFATVSTTVSSGFYKKQHLSSPRRKSIGIYKGSGCVSQLCPRVPVRGRGRTLFSSQWGDLRVPCTNVSRSFTAVLGMNTSHSVTALLRGLRWLERCARRACLAAFVGLKGVRGEALMSLNPTGNLTSDSGFPPPPKRAMLRQKLSQDVFWACSSTLDVWGEGACAPARV